MIMPGIFIHHLRNSLKLFFLISFFLIVPALASGASFIPRILEYSGEIEVDMRNESSESTFAGSGIKASETVLSEMVRLSGTGYIYHPRFVVFLAKITGGLGHEKVENSFSNSGSWNTTTVEEYEFRARILPEHPYHLELFSSRATPRTRGALLKGEKPVNYINGAILEYKKPPLSVNLNYRLSTTTTGQADTDSQFYSATAGYTLGPTYTTAAFVHADSTTTSTGGFSFGAKSVADQYTLDNSFELDKVNLYLFDVKRLKLFSRVELNRNTEESEAALSANIERFLWSEDLSMELPWNFSPNLMYRHSKDLFEGAESVSVTTDSAGLGISHRLYQSLNTSYTLNLSSSTFDQGSSRLIAQSINTSYRKKIFEGATLTATVHAGSSNLHREGPLSALESHSAEVNGFFDLREPGADRTTIVVSVLSVVDPGIVPVFIPLSEGTHYTVTPFGNTFRITIDPVLLTNPDVCRILICPLSQVFEFRVTYTVTGGAVEIGTKDFGYSLKMTLFNNLIEPYYSFTNVKQEIISGSIPGGAEETTAQTFGVLLSKGPYTLRGEYQSLQSNFNPQKAWRLEFDYRKSLTPSAHLTARAYYSNTDYLAVETNPTARAFSERLFGVDATVQKFFFPQRNLNLSVYAAYANRAGLTKTSVYTMNTTLTWKIRAVEIGLGGFFSMSQGELAASKAEYITQFYYLNIKRKIF